MHASRADPEPAPIYEFGPFRLDTRRRLLISESGVVPLTAKLFDTLVVLIEHQPRTVPKDELLRRIWPESVVEEGNLPRNVSTLRRILGDSPGAHQYILTVPGEGYRFVAPVRAAVGSDFDSSGGAPAETDAPAEAPVSTPMEPPARDLSSFERQLDHGRVPAADAESNTGMVAAAHLDQGPLVRRPPAAFGITTALLTSAIILAMSAAVWIASSGLPGTGSQPIRSLAVLPLENLSGDPDQEYFADGITEAIIGRLSTVRGLRVISRTSVMQFKHTSRPVPEIADALNVEAVVVGSVLRSGTRVRVTAQLIDSRAQEKLLWSETFEREVRDVLALQMDVARSVSGSIELALTVDDDGRRAELHPIAPEVYDHYLKGRFALTRPDRAAVQEALAHFEAAIALDPMFAPAYTGLARAYRELGTIFRGSSPQAEMLPKSLAAAEQALRLNPELPEAHVLIGAARHRKWEWGAAEEAFRRALHLNPNDAHAHIGLAHLLVAQGRAEEAIALARQARALDPLSAQTAANVGWTFFFARRYAEAIREYQNSLDLQPDNHPGLWYLGVALARADRFAEAIDALERAAAISDGSPGVLGDLATVYALAGRRDDALRTLDELKRRREAAYVPAAPFVRAYAALGERDQAFTWLERAYEERSNIMWQLKVTPSVDPLRADPRFRDMLRRVGLE